MRTQGEAVYLLLLVALVVLGTSCGGAPTTAETTNRVEQTIETTPTSLADTLDNSEEPADTTTGSNQVGSTSTTVVASTTATPDRELSQAWIEAQTLVSRISSDDQDYINYIYDYQSSNPNNNSTPMGALCWAYHELTRAQLISSLRHTLDHYTIPFFMEQYEVTSEQVGPPGPGATGAFLDLMSDDDIGPVGFTDTGSAGQITTPGGDGAVGPVGSVNEDDVTVDDVIEYFIVMHEFAGDGTAWPDAVRIIASPEMAAAFAAGEGLPAEVQIYADALIAFAEEHVGKPLDNSAESDVLDFIGTDFPGIDAFIEEAKYNQNCKRAMISS